MFILREITSEKLEINTCLDIEYVLVLKKENEKEFEERTRLWPESCLKDVYGVVCFDNGESIIPLKENSIYYVMTSDGKTFSNISKKQN